MFDKAKGKKAVIDAVDVASDEFAARFDELPNRKKLLFLEKANQLLDNPDAVSAFQAGTYAQNSAGQPAQALGVGAGDQPTPQQQVTPQPGQSLEDAALNVIMTSAQVPQGVKAAIIRLTVPSDPNHLPVGTDGTPTELVSTRRERDAAKQERDQVKAELEDERDPNKQGSLAKKLADAQAAAATPADSVTKATVLPLIQAVETAAGNLDSALMTSRISGADELNQAVAAAKAAVI